MLNRKRGEILQDSIEREKYFRIAHREIRKILDIKPDNPWSYAELANIYLAQGYMDKARGAIRKAIKVEPDNAFFKDILSRSERKTGDNLGVYLYVKS